MTRSTLTLSIHAVIAALAVIGTAAAATGEQRPKQVEVHYGDLDLNNEAGATTLLKRLSKASRNVCDSSSPYPSNLKPRSSEFACRNVAMKNAVADVNHPVVTALYQSSHGVAQTKLASR